MLMLSTDTTDTDHMAMVMDTELMDMDTHTDTDTTERDPLMPSPRLMLSTDMLTLHTPMLHTDTDMVWELLLTPVLPPPSWPDLPRVLARGLLMLVSMDTLDLDTTESQSPPPPMDMDLLDTASPRDTPELPPPSSPSPDCTELSLILTYFEANSEIYICSN